MEGFSVILGDGDADVANEIVTNSFRIRNRLDKRAGTCSFTLFGVKITKPKTGWNINVWYDGVKVFGGTIDKVSKQMRSFKLFEYRVECVDYSLLLESRLVNADYSAQTVNDIISNILTNYASTFTGNNVDCAVPIAEISFNYEGVGLCLDKLAQQVGYDWYVDPDKDIHFFDRGSISAPWDLTDTNGYYAYKSLIIDETFNDIKNYVYILGKKSSQTAPFVITSQDATSQAQYGVQDYVLSDLTITDETAAQQLADSIIEAFKDPPQTGRFRTRKAGLSIGEKINIQSTVRGINRDYIITEITWYAKTEDLLEYEVSFKTEQVSALINFLKNFEIGIQGSNEAIGIHANQATIDHPDDSVTSVKAKLSLRGWSNDLDFSSTDADTVSWSSGVIRMSDGTPYSIDAGNTGNMAALTYIYLDIGVSETVLQTSTNYVNAVGDGRLLVAVAKNSTTEAIFQVFGGKGGIKITGVDIEDGSITPAKGDISIQGWQHNMDFSASDNDTVAWGAGVVTISAGSTYNIDAGNTGNMAATTYIYLDINTSITVLQITTTPSTAVGNGKILIAVAKNQVAGKNAIFQVLGGNALGSSPKLLTADDIVSNTITANEIAANTITAGEIAAGAINTDELAANAVTAGKIFANTITANEIAANTITANEIVANTITANEIAANTITANEMNVAILSAISADIGTVTAGTIRGTTIETGDSGKYMKLYTSGGDGILAYYYDGDACGTFSIYWADGGVGNDILGFAVVGGGGSRIRGYGRGTDGYIGMGIYYDANSYGDIIVSWAGSDPEDIYITLSASNNTGLYTLPFNSDLIPRGTQDIGAAATKWQHLYISGTAYIDDIDLDGSIIMDAGETVDGIDISAHAANASAHHSSTSSGIAIVPSSVSTVGLVTCGGLRAQANTNDIGSSTTPFDNVYCADLYRGATWLVDLETTYIAFKKPIGLQVRAGTPGAAAAWQGFMYYDTDQTDIVFSNGVNWYKVTATQI